MEKMVLSYLRLIINEEHVIAEDTNGNQGLISLSSVICGLEGEILVFKGSATPPDASLVACSEMFVESTRICIAASTMQTAVRLPGLETSASDPSF